MMDNSRLLMAIGTTLLLLGVALPFLMVIGMINATFALIFISSGSSTLGLALSMVGLAHYARATRKDRNDKH